MEKITLPVSEIFASIDGEGTFAGCLATFIRLSGCNLRCKYCDTSYALNIKKSNRCDIWEIIHRIQKIGYKHVTITGGEPLIHKETPFLVEMLVKCGFLVNIETNGSLPIDNYINIPNVTVTMDYKTPASGEESKMLVDNISKLRMHDVLKLVMAESDFEYIKTVLIKNSPKCLVYLSPIFGQCESRKLVEFLKMLATNQELGDMTNYRVQIQLHKYIWPPEMRGV